MEYLNLYDKKGKLLNEKGIRGEKSSDLVGVAIIFIENSKGELLIQKTSSSRNSVFATTGGHVAYGSTFEETIRSEVQEELGIDITNEKIVEVNTYIRDCDIQKVYYLKKDIDIKDITIQEDEVEYVKWLDDETINKLIGKGEFREGNIEGYQYLRERTETAILKL